MNIFKNKSKLSTIALILVLVISAMLVALPTVSAQESRTTYAFLGVIPNPVGVNQQVLLHIGITDYLSNFELGWEGMTVTVIDPEGIESTLGPYTTDSTGGTGGVFTPTKIGDYTLQTNFPAQWTMVQAFWSPTATNVTYEASVSDVITLTVLEDPVPYHPGYSMPTEYWTRPIDGQLREWNTISGSWLESSRRAPMVVTGNDDAPESAHILWVTPLTIGGLAGGTTADNHALDCGDAYAGKWDNRLIVAGVLMYVTDPVFDPEQTIAVDLRTGEELWRHDFTFSFGQVYMHDSINRHAAYAYVWRQSGSTLTAYDPRSGNMVYEIVDRPSGTRTYGSKGELLYYSISLNSNTMSLWNSSWAYMEGQTSMSQAWNVLGSTQNCSERGLQWTIDIPADLPGSVETVALGDIVFGSRLAETEVNTWAFSLAPGLEGNLLYNKTWSAPAEWVAGNLTLEENGASVEDDIYTFWTKQNRQHYGFSIRTGDYLWGPTPSETYGNLYGWTSFGERPALISEGKLYTTGVGGITYCYDVSNGTILWTYEAEDPYQEYLFSNNWWGFLQYITDGKVYIGSLEHSAIDPKPRGAPFVCLNQTTGDVIWRANGLFRQTLWGGISIIGDSVIATMDTYDQRIYAVGKGPSTITAESPLVSVPLGTSVNIEGTVTDVSPGTNSDRVKLRFPNGVPAMSDASMSDWMAYVYKQFPKPYATGVTVTVEAIDPNMNYQVLGTTTSDTSGKYGFTFEPEVPGNYMIMVTFYGSNAYFGSTTTTYLSVGPAPEPYPTVTIPPYPGYQGPSASNVAQNVLDILPDNPTSNDIAQEVVNQLPETPEAPEYRTIDLVILIAVAVAIVISLVSLLRKQK